MGWRNNKDKNMRKGERDDAAEVVDLGPETNPDLGDLFGSDLDRDNNAAQPDFDMQRHATAPADDEQWTNIGPSAHFTGELRGEEHVFVEGAIEGKISLPSQNLTVGASGRIAAEIHAHSVIVEGVVQGNITAYRVEVVAAGSVEGDIRAERVVLADGARFRGNIDMGPGADTDELVGFGQMATRTDPDDEHAAFPDPEDYAQKIGQASGSSIADELSVLDPPNEEEPANV